MKLKIQYYLYKIYKSIKNIFKKKDKNGFIY